MLRRLIVNADDFGYTPGVSRGILEAHLNGIVTSTSVMVNGEYAAPWVEQALEQAPELGMGLHIVLTSGPPISAAKGIPALLGADGTFLDKAEFFRLLPSIPEEQIETEIRAQVARFQTIAGKNPDHLDSHHHSTYAGAQAIKAMLTIAEELGIPIRNPLPSNAEHSSHEMVRLGMVGSQAEAAARVDLLHSLLNGSTVRMPDHFIASFYGSGHVTLGDLLNRLVDVQEGHSELMCHPAFIDDILRQRSSYLAPREQEAASLMHPSAQELCAAQFIQLITFRELV